jgi:short-subunit dehydrogenase
MANVAKRTTADKGLLSRARYGLVLLPCPQPRPVMDSLEDKVVIVTGASQGIGAHLATALRSRGSKLVLTARNEARLQAAAGPGDLIVAGDLTGSATRTAIIDQAMARFGRIDVLINNAGRGSYYPPSATPLEDARSLFELNFFAPFHLTQLATPFLLRTGGTVVNVSSIAGQMSLPWLPLYSASKFALTSLSATERMELRRRGVNVMTVFPGYVDTDFQAHATGDRPPARVIQGKRFAVSAEDCSAAIIQGIERRRREVVTPRIGWLAIWSQRLFPGMVETGLAKASLERV